MTYAISQSIKNAFITNIDHISTESDYFKTPGSQTKGSIRDENLLIKIRSNHKRKKEANLSQKRMKISGALSRRKISWCPWGYSFQI